MKQSRHIDHLNILTTMFQRKVARCWREKTLRANTYVTAICALTDSEFSRQPPPAAAGSWEMDGWVIATFVQAPRPKKNLDGRSAGGVIMSIPKQKLVPTNQMGIYLYFILVMSTFQLC